jgi:hypothetical protein
MRRLRCAGWCRPRPSASSSELSLPFLLSMSPSTGFRSRVGADETRPKIFRVTRLLPMRMKRRGVELRIIIDGHEDMPRKADPALLKAVARARRWFEEIASGRVRSSAEIARREALQKGYVARLTRLAFLSPSVVETVVEGRTPVELNLQMLMTTRVALPLAWREQEKPLRNLGLGRDQLIGA